MELVKDILQRQLRRLVAATLFLFVALGGVGAYAFVSAAYARNDLAREETRTNAALCTLRADLARRVQDSRDFLLRHPNGIPGISASVIRIGIVNQQRTVDALSTLHCPTGSE